MKGQVVYGEAKDLGCASAMCDFAWKERDDSEFKSPLKYVQGLEQAQRFAAAKPRLQPGLIGIAVAPLAEAKFTADTVHYYGDTMLAYHLAVDRMAATDIVLPAPEGTTQARPSGAKLIVFSPGSTWKPWCSVFGSAVFLFGSASLTRPGDGVPGVDICTNCPMIVLKKGQ